MTETRRNPLQSTDDFTREAVEQIEAVRDSGARTADEIAEALNRGGFATWHGRQWDAEKVMEFLSSPDTERATLRMTYAVARP